MKIIFCADPLNPQKPDPLYVEEYSIAQKAGFETRLLNFELLVEENDITGAIRRIPAAETPETAIYRGWMLCPQKYTKLYQALEAKGICLINSPKQYRYCHYLPKCYPAIATHTPLTVSIKIDESFSIAAALSQLKVFGNKPIIVKDYVKSRKHEWLEACFIPSAADTLQAEKVIRRFLELQGEDLNEGLVFREFVDFQAIGQHSRSSMPLTSEFRFFFVDGKLLLASEYWEEGEYSDIKPPTDLFADIAAGVTSRFFTMDVAQQLNGEWLIVELGDGQVSGLPELANVEGFYHELRLRVVK